MWLLVRDAASASQASAEPAEERSAASRHVLAACPDSDDRGEPWRWSVSRVGHADWDVEVRSDTSRVKTSQRTVAHPGEQDLQRERGEVLVLVAITGRHLVQDATGPWHRWLEPGDVFVVEGEEDEHLVLTTPEHGKASIVRLMGTGTEPLRWVP